MSTFLLLALWFMAARDLFGNARVCWQAGQLILVGVDFLQALPIGVRHDYTENKQIFQ